MSDRLGERWSKLVSQAQNAPDANQKETGALCVVNNVLFKPHPGTSELLLVGDGHRVQLAGQIALYL
jgi:hypothetical protein